MLSRKTFTYATSDGLPLGCDVYATESYPADSPVVLFFHSGGLVGGARACVPPWLVQACLMRRWPLVSASYRLLPQAKGAGLLADASAAYKFARSLHTAEGTDRRVVVAGASAGFFLATLIGHHLQPPPAALLSITGIATFRHPFFSSSVLLTPEPITHAQVQHHLDGPSVVGNTPEVDSTVFTLNKLLSSGAKNPDYVKPAAVAPPAQEPGGTVPRGCLYDYYLYHNSFLDHVGDVDPGYDWAKTDEGRERLARWPRTILIQGNDDADVDMAVSQFMADCLGRDKAAMCIADGQGHLFEARSFLEDDASGMTAVREALAHLDRVVG